MRRFILLLVMLSAIFSQDNSIKIAVDSGEIGQNYYNIDESTKKSLDQAFSNALFKLTYRERRSEKKVFTSILSGKNLQKIVDEQNFHSEKGCNDDECIFEFGRALGVEYLLIPTVIYQKSGVVRISLKLADIPEEAISSSVDEREVPLCDLEYRNDVIDNMIAELYNNSDQPGSIETIIRNIDGKRISEEVYHRGGIREIIKKDKNGRIPQEIDKNENKRLKIKRSLKSAIKVKKPKAPECTKEEKKKSSSNNMLLIIGLLVLVLVGASGGGGGGSPTGGVDIGITIP